MSSRRSRVTAMIGSLPAEFGGDGRGGVAVHTGKIAEALTGAGESVTVLANDVTKGTPTGAASVAPFRIVAYSPPRKKKVAGLLLKGGKSGDVSGLPPQASVGWRESLWVRAIGRMYHGLIRELAPDIVHVHGVGLTPLAVHRASSRIPAPLVVTVHSLRGHVPDSTFFARSVPSLFVPDALITVSKHLKAEAASYGVDEAKIHVILNGVDRSAFYPVSQELARQRLGIPQDSAIVLLVAHLIERKGADIAVMAMPRILSRVPAAKLYLIGAAQDYTEPVWKERLLDLPRALGIEREVVFLGDIPGHTDGLLNLWYNAADTVILPSRAEGMGMVLTEGMACRKPVIGSRVGGIPDVIADGSNGLLVPPEDPDALACAIVETLTNRELRGRLVDTGIRYVIQEHDWNVVARRTQDVYTEVVERRVRASFTRRAFSVPRTSEISLNLYSDKSFLPPGKDHVAMLSPFWGNHPETPNDPFKGWLDRYAETGNQFFRMTSLDEADLAILPAPWSHVVETAEGRSLAKQFAATARAAGKQTVVFFNSDSTEDVSLDDSLVFRTSLYRSRRKPTEFALPAWSEDLVATHLHGKLPLRPKGDRATVGFCGFAAPLFQSWLRNFARWGAGVAGLRKGVTDPFVSPGHAIRLRAMRALTKTPEIDTNFVVRDVFFGVAVGGATNGDQIHDLRQEYLRNILDSDYTLCVRGVGNFSYRLYETLSCGRIPVFVDTDCLLPYDSVIDWKKYCVYIGENEISQIGEKVAEFHASLSSGEFEQLQRDCRKLWEDFISPEGFFRNFHRHLG